MRKTIEIEKVREAVANYMSSEGCSCCEGSDHGDHLNVLGEMLQMDKYDDGSGYDHYKYQTDKKNT